MEKDLVSFVVVNRNRREFLRECLRSIFAQGYEKEVIVVDNASTDGSVELVKDEFPQVKIIQNNVNYMSAKGYNQGIRASRGEYVFCLNNDVFLKENYLEKVLPKFRKDYKIGAVVGRLINPLKGSLDSTGQFLTPSRRAWERGYGRREAKFEEGYIWGVPGACALYRRQMLEEIKIGDNYFDESYKAYLEDLDLNWRMNKFGWKAYFVPEAIAYHYRGTTGWVRRGNWGYINLPSDLKVQYLKNRYSTLIKNDTLKEVLKHFPFILGYELYLWFFLISSGYSFVLEFFKDLNWVKEALNSRYLIQGKLNKGLKGGEYVQAHDTSN
jgi:GT2 family glycosyltransferase